MTSFPIDFSFLALLSLEAADWVLMKGSPSHGVNEFVLGLGEDDHEKRLRNGEVEGGS